MDDETLIKYAYIKASSNRVKIIIILNEDVKTPTEIVQESGIHKTHVSNSLRELKEIGVVECVNENARKGRIYRITPVGRRVIDKIME